MLTKLKNYFFKLPGFRQWKLKQERRKFEQDQLNIKRGIETLNGLKDRINFKVYDDIHLKEAYDLVVSLHIDPRAVNRLDPLKGGEFYSITTQHGLDFVRKRYFTKDDITQFTGVLLKMEKKPINRWVSNVLAIDDFITMMLTSLRNIKMLLEDPTTKLSRQETEFINSMLFRLLLSDFATLVILILELNYETNQRKI